MMPTRRRINLHVDLPGQMVTGGLIASFGQAALSQAETSPSLGMRPEETTFPLITSPGVLIMPYFIISG